jgi:hypothetical protein
MPDLLRSRNGQRPFAPSRRAEFKISGRYDKKQPNAAHYFRGSEGKCSTRPSSDDQDRSNCVSGDAFRQRLDAVHGRDDMWSWAIVASMLTGDARPGLVVEAKAHLIQIQVAGLHPVDTRVLGLDQHKRSLRVITDPGE